MKKGMYLVTYFKEEWFATTKHTNYYTELMSSSELVRKVQAGNIVVTVCLLLEM